MNLKVIIYLCFVVSVSCKKKALDSETLGVKHEWFACGSHYKSGLPFITNKGTYFPTGGFFKTPSNSFSYDGGAALSPSAGTVYYPNGMTLLLGNETLFHPDGKQMRAFQVVYDQNGQQVASAKANYNISETSFVHVDATPSSYAIFYGYVAEGTFYSWDTKDTKVWNRRSRPW